MISSESATLHSKEAHTAEHIFIGSLQRLANNIFVRKVEHRDSVNKVYVKCPDLTYDAIYEAELMANKVIREDRKVKVHSFPSLEEARKSFPKTRAYEERVSGDVRVIEIDGYDYAACAREHTEKTSQCGFFIVTHLSREQDEYEIEFRVGESAELSALEMSMKSIKVATELGASMKTLEPTARNLRNELDAYKRRISAITEQMLDKVQPESMNGRSVYSSIFDMLDDRTLLKRAGEIIRKPDTVVVFINVNDRATVVFARSENLRVDCNSILRSVLSKYGGGGGGRPNFANGSLPKERAREALDALLQSLEG